MGEDVTIWYRGERFQLGRWQHGYGLWAAREPQAPPLGQWPETAGGWAAAWARFTAEETPGTIVHLAPAAPASLAGPVPAAATGRAAMGTAVPVILIALGVAAGIVGLFPRYLSGQSLIQDPATLVPHVIYLAAWALSAVLLLARSTAGRVGAVFGLGASVVASGFFLADIGPVISAGLHVLGPGLILALDGWLVCVLGTVLALRVRPAGAPSRPGGRRPVVTAVAAGLAALGTAVTFAPSWDRYTLRTPAGVAQTVTAGNAFANPGPVIAGNLVVMIALVAVAVAAGWQRPPRLGAALLAGAAVPMLAQGISALVQIGEGISPAAFGISPSQAERAGLTISSGLTAVFWVYCVFLVLMLAVGAWMMIPARPASRLAPMAGPVPWAPPPGAPSAPAGPAAAPGAPTVRG